MDIFNNNPAIERKYANLSLDDETSIQKLAPGDDLVTIDEWRHFRMYRLIEPLALLDPGKKWLTVGDGRYGLEAQYLAGCKADVTASDINAQLLEKAVEAGVIEKYLRLNAENMSTVADCTFDYALCKESYHHFARPPLALYEMLRVAKKAIVLLEPNDLYCTDSVVRIFFRKIISLLTRVLFGTPLPKDNYESAGNYVYRISVREMEKVAVCLDYPMIAYRFFNDYYIPTGENNSLSNNRKAFRRTRRMIRLQNFMMKIGLYGGRLLGVVIFREMPAEEMQNALRKAGYKLRRLPKNPYVS